MFSILWIYGRYLQMGNFPPSRGSGVKVFFISLPPLAISQVTLIHNNQYDIEAYLGTISTGPQKFLPLKLFWKFHVLKVELEKKKVELVDCSSYWAIFSVLRLVSSVKLISEGDDASMFKIKLMMQTTRCLIRDMSMGRKRKVTVNN